MNADADADASTFQQNKFVNLSHTLDVKYTTATFRTKLHAFSIESAMFLLLPLDPAELRVNVPQLAMD